MMAKKKSTDKSTKKVTKKITGKEEFNLQDPIELTKQDRLNTIKKFNALEKTKTMELPDEAIVNVPISGQFHKALDGLFFHLMDPLNASDIIHTMYNIRNGFEGMKPEEITDTQRAIWTIMKHISEKHWQADAQGLLKETDANLSHTVQKMLHGVEKAPEIISEVAQLRKKAKEKESNEDSPQ